MKEARVFSEYLFGHVPDDTVLARYEFLVREYRADTLVDLCVRNPWILHLADPACGFFRKDAMLRKKLLIAFAVMECTPATAERCHPKKQSGVMIFLAALAAGFSVIRAILGSPILLFFPK